MFKLGALGRRLGARLQRRATAATWESVFPTISSRQLFWHQSATQPHASTRSPSVWQRRSFAADTMEGSSDNRYGGFHVVRSRTLAEQSVHCAPQTPRSFSRDPGMVEVQRLAAELGDALFRPELVERLRASTDAAEHVVRNAHKRHDQRLDTQASATGEDQQEMPSSRERHQDRMAAVRAAKEASQQDEGQADHHAGSVIGVRPLADLGLAGPMDGVDTCSVSKHFSEVTPPHRFRFEYLPKFFRPSSDPQLLLAAKENQCRLASSTSGIGQMLTMVYFGFFGDSCRNLDKFSAEFRAGQPQRFTAGNRNPAFQMLKRRYVGSDMPVGTVPPWQPSDTPQNADDYVWVIDSQDTPEHKRHQILMSLGKVLECQFSMEESEFNSSMVRSPLERPVDVATVSSALLGDDEALESDADDEDQAPIDNEELWLESDELSAPQEAFSFMSMEGLMLRSQLDAVDERVPQEKKVFDLKTRAVLPIRMDCPNYTKYTSYNLDRSRGLLRSYERELFDMVRAAFVKYQFQCRIGNMGGVVVAYHNTKSVFGFEYIPVSCMDEFLYPGRERQMHHYNGERGFEICVKILSFALHNILEVTAQHPVEGYPAPATLRTVMDYQGRIDLPGLPRASPGVRQWSIFVEVPDSAPDAAPGEELPPLHPENFEHGGEYVLRAASLSSAELRAECRRLGLNASGDREDLLTRLQPVCYRTPCQLPGQRLGHPTLPPTEEGAAAADDLQMEQDSEGELQPRRFSRRQARNRRVLGSIFCPTEEVLRARLEAGILRHFVVTVVPSINGRPTTHTEWELSPGDNVTMEMRMDEVKDADVSIGRYCASMSRCVMNPASQNFMQEIMRDPDSKKKERRRGGNRSGKHTGKNADSNRTGKDHRTGKWMDKQKQQQPQRA